MGTMNMTLPFKNKTSLGLEAIRDHAEFMTWMGKVFLRRLRGGGIKI